MRGGLKFQRRMIAVPAKALKADEGYIEVTSTVLKKTTTQAKKIKIRPFATVPAHVEVHFGTWFPTGDMAGAKVDVTIRVPAYIEEIVDVFNQVRDLADDLLEKEVARITGE